MIIAAYVLGLALLVLGGWTYFNGIKFLNSARQIKKKTLASLKLLDKKTKMGYNKIATLSVFELDNYLGQIYSICLDLAAAESASEKDPNVAVILYAKSLEKIQLYLGDETIKAIDYFYGDGYLVKWCELRFNMLNTKKVLNNIIDKSMYVNTIRDALDVSSGRQ